MASGGQRVELKGAAAPLRAAGVSRGRSCSGWRTGQRDAHFKKMDIFSFNPRAKTAHAYNKLIREVFLPSEEPVEDEGQTYEEAAATRVAKTG